MQIQNLFGIGLYIVYKTLNQKQSSQSVLITQEYNYSTISPDFSILQWDMVAPVGHVGAMVAPWRLQQTGTLHGFYATGNMSHPRGGLQFAIPLFSHYSNNMR